MKIGSGQDNPRLARLEQLAGADGLLQPRGANAGPKCSASSQGIAALVELPGGCINHRGPHRLWPTQRQVKAVDETGRGADWPRACARSHRR